MIIRELPAKNIREINEFIKDYIPRENIINISKSESEYPYTLFYFEI